MSSSISTFEQTAWARALRIYAAAGACILLLCAAVLIGFDPYDSGRFAFADGYGVPGSLGPRLTAASTARAPDVEAAIVGNSTIELVQPARLSNLTEMRFVSLAIAGTGPTEQLAVARWFVRHHLIAGARLPKALVFDLDRSWCEDDGVLTLSNPFPFWLYSQSPVEYVLAMLQLRNFENVARKVKLMLGREVPLRADGYRDYETGHDWNRAAAERAFAAPVEQILTSDAPDFLAVARLRAFFAELPASAELVLLFPPRHVSSLPPPESVAARVEDRCKAAYRALAAERAGTVVIDFAVDGIIARDDRLFWDRVHYRGPVARQIEDAIAQSLRASRGD